jgi:hypothetical protein
MHFAPIMPMVLSGLVVGAPLASAEVLNIGASDAPGAKLDDACARAGLDKIRDRLK